MRRKSFYLFMVLTMALNYPLIAQLVTITITDGAKPLPYTSVVNLRTGFGMFATEKGEVVLNPTLFIAGDTLRISYTGYADTLIRLPVDRNQIILQANPIALEEVEVVPCPNEGYIDLKNYKKPVSHFSYSMQDDLGGTWAAYLPNLESVRGYISNVVFELSFFSVPQHARKAPFKVRLLKYDPKTRLPSSTIINKEWMVFPTSKKCTIDISEENIRLPDEGIVVCIAYFFTDEQYTFSRKVEYSLENGKKENRTETYYGCWLKAVDGTNHIGLGYLKNSRFKDWRISEPSNFGPSAPMIKLVIKQCY